MLNILLSPVSLCPTLCPPQSPSRLTPSPLVSRLTTSGEQFIAHHSPNLQRPLRPPPTTPSLGGIPRHRLLETETLIAHLSPRPSRRRPPGRTTTRQHQLLLSSDSESEQGEVSSSRMQQERAVYGYWPEGRPQSGFLTPMLTRRTTSTEMVSREVRSAQCSPATLRRTEQLTSGELLHREGAGRSLTQLELAARAARLSAGGDPRLVMYMRKERQERHTVISRSSTHIVNRSEQFGSSSSSCSSSTSASYESLSHSRGADMAEVAARLQVPGGRRRFIRRDNDNTGSDDASSMSTTSEMRLEVPSPPSTSRSLSGSPGPIRRVSHNQRLCPESQLGGSTSCLTSDTSRSSSPFPRPSQPPLTLTTSLEDAHSLTTSSVSSPGPLSPVFSDWPTTPARDLPTSSRKQIAPSVLTHAPEPIAVETWSFYDVTDAPIAQVYLSPGPMKEEFRYPKPEGAIASVTDSGQDKVTFKTIENESETVRHGIGRYSIIQLIASQVAYLTY